MELRITLLLRLLDVDSGSTVFQDLAANNQTFHPLVQYNPVEISHPHFDGDQGRTVCLDFIFHLCASFL